MVRKRVLLLINGTAGTGSADSNALKIITELAEHGCEVTVYPIVPSEGLDSEAILPECDGRFDIVACSGGDGTLNHVINGMMHMQDRPPLGYIPSGSTNDFAHSIGVPSGILAQCDAIAGDHTFAYDIGQFGDRYFNYIAAFGAFTAISYDTNQVFKNAMGHAAYMIKALATLPQNLNTRCAMRIEHDGIVEEDEYLFGSISNASRMAGFDLPFDHIELSDGVFEVMLIKAPKFWIEVQPILNTLLSGRTDNQYIQVFQTKSLHITAAENTSWTMDGEYGGSVKEVDVSVAHEAMRILLPPPEKAEAIEAANQPIFPE